jgi:DNA-binding NarL/FixJ family response regulator
MKVLVGPTTALESECTVRALQRIGVTTTAEPGPDIEAVVWMAVEGSASDMACALYDDPDGPPVLVISPHLDAASQRLAHRLGAAALLSWDTSSQVLLDTITRLVEGTEPPIITATTGLGDPLGDLTVRELEVVDLLGSGASNTDIAEALGISYHTARTHVAHVLAKLGVSHRYAVVALARGGWDTRPLIASGGSP